MWQYNILRKTEILSLHLFNSGALELISIFNNYHPLPLVYYKFTDNVPHQHIDPKYQP